MDGLIHDKALRTSLNSGLYEAAPVIKMVSKFITKEDSEYFQKKGRTMTSDVNQANEETNKAINQLQLSLNKFVLVESAFVDKAKKAQSNVRDAAEKISVALARVENSAKFSELEKYVSILERAAQAMSVLNDLEKSGALAKINIALASK